jgi:hypothetical protein
MKAYKHFIWILALLIAGCASMATPETNLERLAYMEITYGVVLDKATVYRAEGKLSESQIAQIDKAFDAYEQARDLARIAITAKDQGGFDSQSTTMITILSALRSLVSEANQ